MASVAEYFLSGGGRGRTADVSTDLVGGGGSVGLALVLALFRGGVAE